MGSFNKTKRQNEKETDKQIQTYTQRGRKNTNEWKERMGKSSKLLAAKLESQLCDTERFLFLFRFATSRYNCIIFRM